MALPFTRDVPRPWIAAGDFAMELRSIGWREPSPVEKSTIIRPQLVREVADAFVMAGAEVLITNTAAANSAALAAQLDSGTVTVDELGQMNRSAVQIFRTAIRDAAVGPRILLGAIGAGDDLLLLEETDEDALHEVFGAQARELAASGVDGLCCTGFRELGALLCAVRAAIDTGLPVAAGMIFDCGADEAETTLGVTVPQFCHGIADAGAAIALCDSGESPDRAAALVALARESCELPVWVNVSAGTAQLNEGRIEFSDEPASYAGRLAQLAKAGAAVIGGGRGTTPEHIAALIGERDRFRRK